MANLNATPQTNSFTVSAPVEVKSLETHAHFPATVEDYDKQKQQLKIRYENE